MRECSGALAAGYCRFVFSLYFGANGTEVAHYLGPYLPDLSGALVSFWVLFIFVKIWRPKTIRGFGGAPLAASTSNVTSSR